MNDFLHYLIGWLAGWMIHSLNNQLITLPHTHKQAVKLNQPTNQSTHTLISFYPKNKRINSIYLICYTTRLGWKANFFIFSWEFITIELKKTATYCAIGFAVMGVVGYLIKLVFIPINNIILTNWAKRTLLERSSSQYLFLHLFCRSLILCYSL